MQLICRARDMSFISRLHAFTPNEKFLLHYYFWFLMYMLWFYCWLLFFEYAILDFRSIIYIRLKNHRLKWPGWGESSVKCFKGRVLISLSVEWERPPLCPAVLSRLGNAADGPALLRRNGPPIAHTLNKAWVKSAGIHAHTPTNTHHTHLSCMIIRRSVASY